MYSLIIFTRFSEITEYTTSDQFLEIKIGEVFY